MIKKFIGGGYESASLLQILTKGGYRCSFPDEGWCHALDCMTRDWL